MQSRNHMRRSPLLSIHRNICIVPQVRAASFFCANLGPQRKPWATKRKAANFLRLSSTSSLFLRRLQTTSLCWLLCRGECCG
jgi:hypothetical protein